MPRSVGLFRKVGFPVIAWPVDYRTSGKEGIGLFRDNAADSLQNTTMAVREWSALSPIGCRGGSIRCFPAAGVGQGRAAPPRGREELPPDQHDDQQNRRQHEHGRADEPAEIADRKKTPRRPALKCLPARMFMRAARLTAISISRECVASSRTTGTAPMRMEQ